MKQAESNPLWRNEQTPSSEETPMPEKNEPVIEAQQQNDRSRKQKKKH